MHFLSPHLLHLLWLALIPLALYLFRKRARRVPVSTLLFFRSLSREHQESAWLRKVKKWLSLAMTLLVLLLAVLALAKPVSQGDSDSPGAVIVVVDRSASMAALDETGKTRVEEARRVLAQRLGQLPNQVVISLVAYDARAQVVLSRNRNRRECMRLLAELKPQPIEGHADEALTVVRRLAVLEKETQVWHVGDIPWTDTEGLNYEFINVALPQVLNVGITSFQIRQAPLAHDRYEGFLKVSAAAANPKVVTTTLEITVAGRLAQLRELELKPGEASTLMLPLEGIRGQRVEIRLKTPGDQLGWDDAVAAPLPKSRPLVVAWVADKPDPFTELAMTSMIEAGRIEMLRGTPASWPMKDKPDVYVFEHWLPETWPADRPVIALNPVKSAGSIKLKPLPGLGVPHDSLRSVMPDHPVLYRVSPTRLAVTQTSLLDLETAFEPLWMAGAEPVLAAGEVNGQRVVVTAFSPARSEQLALLPAFPLMLGNALYWAAEERASTLGLTVLHPGELLEEAGLIQWTEWTGTQLIETSESVTSGLLPIHRLGAWHTETGRVGTSLLVSAQETDIPAQTNPTTAKALPELKGSSGVGNWPRVLIWGLLGTLLLESFLFHRKAVF